MIAVTTNYLHRWCNCCNTVWWMTYHDQHRNLGEHEVWAPNQGQGWGWIRKGFPEEAGTKPREPWRKSKSWQGKERAGTLYRKQHMQRSRGKRKLDTFLYGSENRSALFFASAESQEEPRWNQQAHLAHSHPLPPSSSICIRLFNVGTFTHDNLPVDSSGAVSL